MSQDLLLEGISFIRPLGEHRAALERTSLSTRLMQKQQASELETRRERLL